MELIDRNALLNDNYCNHCLYKKYKSCDKTCERMGHNILATRRMIEDAPAVDAVPVVRCKDCKYSMPNDGVLVVGAMYCTQTLDGCNNFTYVWDDDYCSNGERKEVQE